MNNSLLHIIFFIIPVRPFREKNRLLDGGIYGKPCTWVESPQAQLAREMSRKYFNDPDNVDIEPSEAVFFFTV